VDARIVLLGFRGVQLLGDICGRKGRGSHVRLLFLNQYFGAGQGATGQLLEELCTALARRGHQVKVIAAAVPYATQPPKGAPAGIEVERVGPKHRRERLAGYLSYQVCSTLAAYKAAPHSVIIAQSSPPMLIVPAALVAMMRGVPLVHVAQDLYPDVAEALGVIPPNGAIASVLRALRALALRRCQAVVVPGHEMAERLARSGCPAKRVKVVPNWAEPRAYASSNEQALKMREKFGIADQKVIMYAGNLGRAHTYRELLDVAGRWLDRADRVLLFMGGGPMFQEAREETVRRGLEQVVRFVPYCERGDLGAALAAADIHVVTQREETFGTVVPSKLYGVLAAGRPVVFVGPGGGEVERVLLESGAGERISPDDAHALERALEGYLLNDARRIEAGRAALEWSRTRGGLDKAVRGYAEVLDAAARSTGWESPQ
jgi:glycosyltransferase involved in cell wall biosynthesis